MHHDPDGPSTRAPVPVHTCTRGPQNLLSRSWSSTPDTAGFPVGVASSQTGPRRLIIDVMDYVDRLAAELADTALDPLLVRLVDSLLDSPDGAQVLATLDRLATEQDHLSAKVSSPVVDDTAA